MCAQLLLDDELNEHVGEVRIRGNDASEDRQSPQVKDARLKIMLYIRGELGTDRPIAWSVWSRRSSPEQRGTPKLKASNGMFRDLSGLPNKTPGPYSRLFPQASVPVLTEKQNNDAEASRQRLFYMMDSYLHRGLHQGRGTIVHQSQNGSIQYVYLRQVVYRVNDDFYELIAGEVLITEPKVSVDLHPIYGVLFNEERLAAYTDYVARRRAQLCGIEHSTNVPGWTLHGQQQDDVPHKERRRKVPAGFVCAFCGTSETPETRYASAAHMQFPCNSPICPGDPDTQTLACARCTRRRDSQLAM